MRVADWSAQALSRRGRQATLSSCVDQENSFWYGFDAVVLEAKALYLEHLFCNTLKRFLVYQATRIKEELMEAFIQQSLGNPALLAVLLFFATFVMEEVAIFVAAGLAASGELNTAFALASLIGGMITSDWCLYGVGAMARRHERIARWVSPQKLEQGQILLGRSTLVAGLLARIVPWLLAPVFMASGFLRVGFRRFALVNATIAVVYIPFLFFGAFSLYASLLERLGIWALAVAAAVVVLILWGVRLLARHYLSGTAASES